MRKNQISLFTKPSTSNDDLSEMELKLRMLNKIHLNKSNTTHPTHQKLYDTLYDSVTREGRTRRKDVDQEDAYVHNHPNAGWFTKKTGSTNAMRRTTWFELLLKLEIDQNWNHILGPSIVAIAKKLKELIHKDKLTIADLKGAGLEKLKQQYKNDVELEYHVDQLKAIVLTEAEWNVGECDMSKPRSFERHMSMSIKPHPSFYNNNFYYLNRVEDLQLGVESYQRTLNITKPKLYFEGIEDRIPYTMSRAEKEVVYLNQHNRRSLMKLNEVKKFYDGTLTKIPENLIDMVNKNELGRGNKRLKGRDWNDKDIKRSTEMLDEIDQVMKSREQLRRFEEYVGGRPETIDPRFYIRPM
ncbi:hypothetical protein Tco_0804244 [Tanacetum coccineum]|uniref:Uncharacterized protein n=1 Tax=Tanacetum coccineum TaxID=301880 RepID=A0ABQ5A6M6_9ASTR